MVILIKSRFECMWIVESQENHNRSDRKEAEGAEDSGGKVFERVIEVLLANRVRRGRGER